MQRSEGEAAGASDDDGASESEGASEDVVSPVDIDGAPTASDGAIDAGESDWAAAIGSTNRKIVKTRIDRSIIVRKSFTWIA